jgi:hypothetical protein
MLRDEGLRLPYFKGFFCRRLGVNRFFVVNYKSVDGSEEMLMQQADCHIFCTDAHLPLAEATKAVEVNSLLNSKFMASLGSRNPAFLFRKERNDLCPAEPKLPHIHLLVDTLSF